MSTASKITSKKVNNLVNIETMREEEVAKFCGNLNTLIEQSAEVEAKYSPFGDNCTEVTAKECTFGNCFTTANFLILIKMIEESFPLGLPTLMSRPSRSLRGFFY